MPARTGRRTLQMRDDAVATDTLVDGKERFELDADFAEEDDGELRVRSDDEGKTQRGK